MPANFHTVTLAEISQWPTPNYTDPVARTWLPGFAIFWEVFATLFVFGRLYLRLRNQSGPFGYDDACIFAAWVFSIAFTATACMSVWHFDVGRHIWDVRPDRYEGALYWAWLAQVMFTFSTGATKASVLLFYRRMAKTSYSNVWIYCVWGFLAITIAFWIAIFFAYCFICSPLNTYWDIHQMMAIGDGQYTCLNGDALTIASGIITIASDFWSAAIPCAMFYYYDLGVSKRQKIALNIIFCLGFLVTGVGIARTYYLWEIGHEQDLSWIGFDLFVCSIVEAQLGIICTCAPFLRVLFRRYFTDRTHITRSNGTNGTSVSRTWRDTRRWTGRGGSSQHTRPLVLADTPTPPPPMDIKGEKKGFLVHEDVSGRLVWSDRPSGSSDHMS